MKKLLLGARLLFTYGYCSPLIILCLAAFPSMLSAQKTPVNFELETLPVSESKTNYTINGFSTSTAARNYQTSRNYNLRFAQTNATTNGLNRVVKSFEVAGETYSLHSSASMDAKPYKKAVINRASGENKVTSLFEVPSEPSTAEGSYIYLLPDYVETMEELINSFIINRGTDNLLVRGSTSSTSNNITRIDLILDEPVPVPLTEEGREKTGFLLMERGGNDRFKVAAITNVTGGEDPVASGFGSLVPVAASAWGTTGQSIQSVVMAKTASDADLRPSQYIPAQALTGVFITLGDLGTPVGDTVYGISLVAYNATSATSFPETAGDADGGIDFMAGGGIFTRAFDIEGTIWGDANGDAIRQAGSEDGVSNGLWVSLVDASGNVLTNAQVNPDGTYSMSVAESKIGATTYSIILTNTEKHEGEILTDADEPANDYVYTGTNFNDVADTTNETGKLELGTITESIAGADFGINKRPQAAELFTDIEDPSPGDIILLDGAGGNPPLMSGSDAEDGTYEGSAGSVHDPRGVVIRALPSDAELYYDGVLLSEDDVSNATLFANPALFSLRLTGSGYNSTSFHYAYVDMGGDTSSTPGVYTLSWDTPLPVSLGFFTAYEQDGAVVLHWTTLTESANKGFEVQRSAGGKDWSDIGFVPCKAENGSSAGRLDYEFTDREPLLNNYYRLKQEDLDGRCTYSAIKQVSRSEKRVIVLYPNPVTDKLTISGIKGRAGIILSDADGRELARYNMQDVSSYLLDMTQYPGGIYLVQVTGEGGQMAMYKVVKK